MLRRIKILLTVSALILLPMQLPAAKANDRMAGSQKTVQPAKTKKQSTLSTKNSPYLPLEKLNTHETSAVLNINIRTIEELGIYDNAHVKSLGGSIWENSDYEEISSYIAEITGRMEQRAIKQLLPRLLLTKAPIQGVKKYKRPQTGQDLFTLRIEALLKMGLFDEAAQLYSTLETAPYHLRLAKAGALALMAQGQNELACLEVLSMQQRFKNDLYWQVLSELCATKIGAETDSDKKDTLLELLKDKENALEAFYNDKSYKIFKAAAKKPSYNYKLKNEKDLSELNDLGNIPLFALGYINSKKIDIRSRSEISSLHTSLLINDPQRSRGKKLSLIVHNVKYGYLTHNTLLKFYENTKFGSIDIENDEAFHKQYKGIKGWKRLPYLYQAFDKTDNEFAKLQIINKAFSLNQEYGSDALIPFLGFITDIRPEDFSKETIRNILQTMIISNQEINTDWLKTINNKHNDIISHDMPMQIVLALGIDHDLSTLADNKNKEKIINFNELDKVYQSLTYLSYEKLDKLDKLHNYALLDSYEKEAGLTSREDYVMPLGDLLKALSHANDKNATAENLLIITMILQDAEPHKLDSEAFGKIIHSLVTVGLTNEAQFLVKQAIIGL